MPALGLEGLTAACKSFVEARREPRTFKRGDRIYTIDDPSAGLYILRKGLVGLVYHSAKGSDHLLRIFKTGQFFGHRSFFADEPHHATALALEQIEVDFVPRDAVEHVFRMDPKFARIVIVSLAKELRHAEIWRVLVSEQDVLARTAHSVVILKDLDPEHPWTRAEIANFCASTPPSVVRALAELEARGLVRQTGRAIEIVDRWGLLQIETETD